MVNEFSAKSGQANYQLDSYNMFNIIIEVIHFVQNALGNKLTKWPWFTRYTES